MHRLIHHRPLAGLALLLAVSFLSGCPPSSTARKGLADIATGLKAGDKVVQTLYINKAISAVEARAIEGFIRSGTTLNDSLNGCVDLINTAAKGSAQAAAASP